MSNALVDELARWRPQTADALLAIKGMGPAKVRQYGEQLLELLTSQPAAAEPAADETPHFSESAKRAEPAPADDPSRAADAIQPGEPSASPAPMPAGPPEAPSAAPPSHYWTWRMLAAGFTPEECAAARSLASEVVLDHALRAADEGHPVEAAWFLAPERIARIERLLGDDPPTRLRPLLEKLPRGTRYEELQLVVKSRRARASRQAPPG